MDTSAEAVRSRWLAGEDPTARGSTTDPTPLTRGRSAGKSVLSNAIFLLSCLQQWTEVTDSSLPAIKKRKWNAATRRAAMRILTFEELFRIFINDGK